MFTSVTLNTYQLVVRNVYDNYYQRHVQVVRLLCNIKLPNLPGYHAEVFVSHLMVLMQIHLVYLYNDPTKIDPKIHHHSHLFAAGAREMNKKQKCFCVN